MQQHTTEFKKAEFSAYLVIGLNISQSNLITVLNIVLNPA